MEISTAGWSLRFRFPETGILKALVSFFKGDGKESITAGTFDGIPVEVRRDCEFAHRFFIVVGQGCAYSEFTIAGQQQVLELREALSQAAEDLT
jgi:hypothetical protein